MGRSLCCASRRDICPRADEQRGESGIERDPFAVRGPEHDVGPYDRVLRATCRTTTSADVIAITKWSIASGRLADFETCRWIGATEGQDVRLHPTTTGEPP